MTREPIRSIQTGLNTLGHNPGPIDRLFGNNTRVAAERWLANGGRAAASVASPVPPAQLPATSAMIYQGASRHPVREIIFHCAATRPDWMAARPLSEKVARSGAGTATMAGTTSAITGSSTATARFCPAAPRPSSAPTPSARTAAPSGSACSAAMARPRLTSSPSTTPRSRVSPCAR